MYYYYDLLCLWKVFRQSTEQWTFETCKTRLERLGRASKDRFEASFCGTVIVHCCCFMLLLVSCFMKPGFVRSFRIDCLKAAIIDFITKAGSEDRCSSRVLLHLSSLVLSGQLVKKQHGTCMALVCWCLFYRSRKSVENLSTLRPLTLQSLMPIQPFSCRKCWIKHGLKQETAWWSCTVEVCVGKTWEDVGRLVPLWALAIDTELDTDSSQRS